MELKLYIDSLSAKDKQTIINLSWNALSDESLSSESVKNIFESFYSFTIYPEFTSSGHTVDLQIFNRLIKEIGVDNTLLKNLFDYFSAKQVKYYSSQTTTPEEELADIYYHKFNNSLSEPFLKKYFVPLPDIKHPILHRAKETLDLSLKDPDCFVNFVNLFSENKKIFFAVREHRDFLTTLSDNATLNEELKLWNSHYQTDKMSGWRLNKRQQKFLESLKHDIAATYDKIYAYFIKYPEHYVQLGKGKLPPTFVFNKFIQNPIKHYLHLEAKHLEIFIKNKNNTAYEDFVYSFLLSNGKLHSMSSKDIKHYFLSMAEKNLPMNDLMNSSSRYKHLHSLSDGQPFEHYVQNTLRNTDNDKLYLEIRKIRFDHLIHQNNPTVQKFKI